MFGRDGLTYSVLFSTIVGRFIESAINEGYARGPKSKV